MSQRGRIKSEIFNRIRQLTELRNMAENRKVQKYSMISLRNFVPSSRISAVKSLLYNLIKKSF